MSRLTDRLEHDLREVAARAEPSPLAWEAIAARFADDDGSEFGIVLAPGRARSKRAVWPAVAAAAVLVIIGSVVVLTGVDDDDGSISTDVPALTETFVSPWNGFSVRYPHGASVTPAVQLWDFAAVEPSLGERPDDGFDVVDVGSGTVFRGTSTVFPSPWPCLDADEAPISCGTVDEQIDRLLADSLPGHCGVPRGRLEEIVIDGQSARVGDCPNHVEATVVSGGRLYLFTLSGSDDTRALFDAWIATVDLTPDTAIEYPGMTTTVASPTYGYSFDFHDRGGLAPATQPWDPSNQPIEDLNFDPRFDGVETGLGAYFEAASTDLPEGVSVDEWVDTYVTPRSAGGCGVPRSEQEEISIDGQQGRKAECGRSEATVVAGGRLYLFTGPDDDREWFDAWIATIDLTPETAEGTR